MRLLLDHQLSWRALERLDPVFTNSQALLKLGAEEWSDERVWHYARSEGLTVVSKDIDFLPILSRFGFPPQLIRLTIGNTSVSKLVETLNANRDQMIAFHREQTAGILTF